MKLLYAVIFTAFALVAYLEFTAPSYEEALSKRDAQLWNNGICTNCNTVLEFYNASYYRGQSVYYFKCKKCNNIVDLKSKIFVKN